MGRIECQKHGFNDFIDVCCHIGEDLKKGIYPKMNSFSVLGTKVCDYCFNNLQLDKLDSMNLDDLLNLPEEKLKKEEDIIGGKYDLIPQRSQHCVGCVEEIKKKNKTAYNKS